MSREVMQMALEALNRAKPACFADTTITAIDDAITALRQALVDVDDTSQKRVDETAKREHEWVGLTDGEIDILSCEMVKGYKSVNWLCKVLEAKLKENNCGH